MLMIIPIRTGCRGSTVIISIHTGEILSILAGMIRMVTTILTTAECMAVIMGECGRLVLVSDSVTPITDMVTRITDMDMVTLIMDMVILTTDMVILIMAVIPIHQWADASPTVHYPIITAIFPLHESRDIRQIRQPWITGDRKPAPQQVQPR